MEPIIYDRELYDNHRRRGQWKNQRIKAKYRLASLGLGRDSEGNPVCDICGCPHLIALDIGHINDDGKEHREKIGDVSRWVTRLSTSDKEIIDSNIRLECIYCNQFKARSGRYPMGYEKPQWLGGKED